MLAAKFAGKEDFTFFLSSADHIIRHLPVQLGIGFFAQLLVR